MKLHPEARTEPFNGRINELLQTTRFASASELLDAIKHYERLYNHCIPQKALGYKTPIEALKKWQKKKLELFRNFIIYRKLTIYENSNGFYWRFWKNWQWNAS